jgi:hypothetical protein
VTTRDHVHDAIEAALALLPAPPVWDDADELLEAALPVLHALRASPSLFPQLLADVERGTLPLLGSDRGVHWVHLADHAELDVSLDLRFTPLGGVSAPHEHLRARALMLLHGAYRQTLIGVGGGVASPEEEIPLYIRHEPAGQLFALTAEQRHASSSVVGTLMLALQPYEAYAAAADCHAVEPDAVARKLARALRGARLLA